MAELKLKWGREVKSAGNQAAVLSAGILAAGAVSSGAAAAATALAPKIYQAGIEQAKKTGLEFIKSHAHRGAAVGGAVMAAAVNRILPGWKLGGVVKSSVEQMAGGLINRVGGGATGQGQRVAAETGARINQKALRQGLPPPVRSGPRRAGPNNNRETKRRHFTSVMKMLYRVPNQTISNKNIGNAIQWVPRQYGNRVRLALNKGNQNEIMRLRSDLQSEGFMSFN